MFGRGREVCAAHVTADNFEVNARNWFAGFMSSFNIYQPETFDITGTDTSWHLWLVEYCRLNPTLTLADATKAFIGVYYDTRLSGSADNHTARAATKLGENPWSY